MQNAIREINKSDVIREKLAKSQASPLQAYKALTVGNVSWAKFVIYELLNLLVASLPGALGFLLRRKLYPMLFKSVGKGVIIGRNVVLRHPHKITLGDNVTIDDNSLLDGRGSGEQGIVLEDNVIINRNCLVLAKAGPIHLGTKTTIGSNSVLVSMDGVRFGHSVLVAGGCALSAGAYHTESLTVPIMEQGTYTKGPISIGDGVWLGTGAIILDGISVGDGAVVGAGAVVTKPVAKNAIVAGVPAKVIRMRA